MLKYHTVIVTPFGQNARIVFDDSGRSNGAAVVDPGGDLNLIFDALGKNNLKCEQIWVTHSHVDHCGGVAELKDKTGASFYAHRAGAAMRANLLKICSMYGLPGDSMRNCPEPDGYIDEGDVLSLGESSFEVRFTPGHSPDHVVFYSEESRTLISGDTLFLGSVGRSDLPGGDQDELFDSIKSKIYTLPPETVVKSGHGPDTSVGHEMKSNPFVREA